MYIKKFLTVGYWNFEKVVLLLGLLVAIATLIYTAHPTFLFPEKVSYNPEIKLEKTLLSQQYLIYFENVTKSSELDKIESFEILDTDLNEKQIILKFTETDNSDRFIFVALTDPNNIIRFVSMPLANENVINRSLSFALRRISVQKQVRIIMPISNEFNIQGTWHLNIYVYNSAKELSLVITRPLDLSTFQSKSYFESILLFFIAVLVTVLVSIIHRILKSSKIDNSEQVSPVNIEKIHTNQPDVSQKDQELNEIQGIIVDVPKYGLIKRCNNCNQILEKGICREHGKVDFKYDLYIEAILFDGFSEHIILIERPIIENLFKINLDQCITIAMEYLDISIIREMIKKQMLGRFYLIEGIYLAEGMKAKSIKINSQITRMELLSLYDRWKMTEAARSKIN